MKKPVTKIICATLAAVVAGGACALAACSPYNGGKKLDYAPTDAATVSNGGFAVEKGGYVYFINGVESNTADNAFGKPVKGSIMRITAEDLKARNYSSVDTVVPQIAYSSSYETGIFVYGDYVYYSTPSTSRTSDGTVQNGNLELKRTKLDGTESMREAYITFPSLSYNFRFVEVDGVVYILYAASESIYGESSSVTNLHSFNTSTRKDELLAYNVTSYLFDAEDKTNPRVYYTMNVFDTTGNTQGAYNQIYTVRADQTTPKEYDLTSLQDWWDEDSNHYVNCGDLVFDGIGSQKAATPFNYKSDEKNTLDFTYTLETYRGGHLFYTRHTSVNSAENLFSFADKDISSEWNAVKGNPAAASAILADGSGADGYFYLFDDGELKSVIISTGTEINVNKIKDGKLSEKVNNDSRYRIIDNAESITLLFIDGDYLYYSASDNGNNGYTFFRVDYTGEWHDYTGFPASSADKKFTPVRILDLDASSDWYKPELLEGTLLFASETKVMTSYNYVMAFDIGDRTNADIEALNEQYNKVISDDGIIADYGDSDKFDDDIYANLANAARYLFYTGDIEYVKELAAECNADVEEGDNPIYSESTLKKLEEFLAPADGNDWADYKTTRKLNGKDVYSNTLNYYYSLLGKMSKADGEAYAEAFKTEYLQPMPEEEQSGWWAGLNTAAKVCFIIGMCLAGVLVLGGGVICVLVLLRKKKDKKPVYAKRRIKVDTTDDKSVDVYGTGESQPEDKKEEEEEILVEDNDE